MKLKLPTLMQRKNEDKTEQLKHYAKQKPKEPVIPEPEAKEYCPFDIIRKAYQNSNRQGVIIFIDEEDSLIHKRPGKYNDKGLMTKAVKEMIKELDELDKKGMEEVKTHYHGEPGTGKTMFIDMINNPDMIDEAVKRAYLK